MEVQEKELARAAASLAVADFHWLREHHALQEAPPSSAKTRSSPPSHAREESSQERRTGGKKRNRQQVEHEWPNVGTILEADYYGQHYESEIIAAPAFRAGKAVKILNGPAAGLICRSMSSAMLKATESQREEQGLGKKAVANGWTFWRVNTR